MTDQDIIEFDGIVVGGGSARAAGAALLNSRPALETLRPAAAWVPGCTGMMKKDGVCPQPAKSYSNRLRTTYGNVQE